VISISLWSGGGRGISHVTVEASLFQVPCKPSGGGKISGSHKKEEENAGKTKKGGGGSL